MEITRPRLLVARPVIRPAIRTLGAILILSSSSCSDSTETSNEVPQSSVNDADSAVGDGSALQDEGDCSTNECRDQGDTALDDEEVDSGDPVDIDSDLSTPDESDSQSDLSTPDESDSQSDPDSSDEGDSQSDPDTAVSDGSDSDASDLERDFAMQCTTCEPDPAPDTCGPTARCIGFSGVANAFCSVVCDEDRPCPLGWSCVATTDGDKVCSPVDPSDCGRCEDVSCPAEEMCRPSDGLCYAIPTPCESDEQCPDEQLCDTLVGRCVPVGLACRYRKYGDCDSYDLSCSATSVGMEGECLPKCEDHDECPESEPECLYFHAVGRICVDTATGLDRFCAHYAPFDSSVGRPCPQSEDTVGCFGDTDTCLTGVLADVAGFCTMVCDTDEVTPCPEGSQCLAIPGQDDTMCVPDTCRCASMGDDADDGENCFD